MGQHRFVRPEASVAGTGRGQGLSSGELVVVSTDTCLTLIISLTAGSVEVTLDRDLTQLSSEGAVFQDRYIYQRAQSSCYEGVAR